jgi:hypothetical protein
LREVAQAQCGNPFGIDLEVIARSPPEQRKVRNPQAHFPDLRIGRDGLRETQNPPQAITLYVNDQAFPRIVGKGVFTIPCNPSGQFLFGWLLNARPEPNISSPTSNSAEVNFGQRRVHEDRLNVCGKNPTLYGVNALFCGGR